MDKKLQAKWYKKLKDKGFKDIEDSEERLKYWDSQYFQNRRSKAEGQVNARPNSEKAAFSERADFRHFRDKQDYFYLATHFLNAYPFEDRTEFKFWELHLNGKSNREIEKLLKIGRKRLGEIMHCLIEAMKVWKF